MPKEKKVVAYLTIPNEHISLTMDSDWRWPDGEHALTLSVYADGRVRANTTELITR